MKLRLRTDLVDAGLDWIGLIPKAWTTRRLGYFFDERRTKVSDRDFPPLSVTMKGVVAQLENVAKTDDGDNRKLVLGGDFVINSRSDRKGSGGIAPKDGSVSLINTVLIPRDGMNAQFADYLLTSYPFQEEFYRVGRGIVADMWTTKYCEMKNICLAVPKEDEQRAIVAHLNQATARIDTLVARKIRFIELLREKRQALITHAVTKGVYSSVPMKNSGVEWLGMVPAHWNVVPPSALFTESKERARPGDQMLSATQKYGVIPLAEFEALEERRVTKAAVNLEMRKHVDIGDFVISMRSMDGGLESARATGSVRSSYSVLKPGHGVVGRYFGALLKSSLYIQALRLTSNFIREGQDLSFTHVKKVWLPVPPKEEQVAIADHLDLATTRIDTLLAKTERSIELLREHRTALITAAVTGKIDLRDAA